MYHKTDAEFSPSPPQIRARIQNRNLPSPARIKDLKAENNHVYDHWFKDLDERNSKYSALLDKLYLLEQTEKKV